jgi:hypothetical protein
MSSKANPLYRHEHNHISKEDFIKKLRSTQSRVDFMNTLIDGVNNWEIEGCVI